MGGSFITMLFMNFTFYQFVQYKEHVNNLFMYISFLFAIFGSLGLIMLSVFDNLDHLLLHDSFVAIFMWGLFTLSRMAVLTPLGRATWSVPLWFASTIFICDYHIVSISGFSWLALWSNFHLSLWSWALLLPFGSLLLAAMSSLILRLFLNGVRVTFQGCPWWLRLLTVGSHCIYLYRLYAVVHHWSLAF